MGAIMDGFRIFQDSAYAKILCIQALDKVLHMAE